MPLSWSCAAASRSRKKSGACGERIEMSVPEVRRLLAALGASPEEQRLHLHWSTFRRRHQATSKRLHALRRAHQAPRQPAQLPAPVPLCGLPALTETHWQRITPLLPPQTPQRGRRAEDYHRMLEGMLWIVRDFLIVARTAGSLRPLGDGGLPLLSLGQSRSLAAHPRGLTSGGGAARSCSLSVSMGL